MTLQASEMIRYLNYAAIGILVVAALRAFWHGIFKSTFFFIWTVGILVLAFILMNPISTLLMKQDLGFPINGLNLDIGVPITNIEETVIAYIIHTRPEMASVLV